MPGTRLHRVSVRKPNAGTLAQATGRRGHQAAPWCSVSTTALPALPCYLELLQSCKYIQMLTLKIIAEGRRTHCNALQLEHSGFKANWNN